MRTHGGEAPRIRTRSITRHPFDARRLETLATYAEAHRPSPYVQPPVRRLLGGLAPPEGVIELRDGGRTVFVGAVVDRCENVRDAAILEVLGLDEEARLQPLLDVAVPIAVEVARAARRKALTLSLPEPLATEVDLAGWEAIEGSYVLERGREPWASPPLPPGAAWRDLAPDGVRTHYDVVRAAFVDDPQMMLPDFDTFAAASLASDPPVRVLMAGDVELGFARVTVEEGGRLGYVATVGRNAAARGQGLGAVVLAEALRVLAARKVDRFRLGVTATNAPALALYRRTGFEVVETWRGWARRVAP